MTIKKEYKFYAGHRNQGLIGTHCFRPHGHDYKVFIIFNVIRHGAITTLFSDFDNKIEPMLKQEFDHRMMIDNNDPLLPYLQQSEKDGKGDLGLKILPFATSVENVTFFIFNEIVSRFNFDIERIELQETRTSTFIYTKEDYSYDLLFTEGFTNFEKI